MNQREFSTDCDIYIQSNIIIIMYIAISYMQCILGYTNITHDMLEIRDSIISMYTYISLP